MYSIKRLLKYIGPNKLFQMVHIVRGETDLSYIYFHCHCSIIWPQGIIFPDLSINYLNDSAVKSTMYARKKSLDARPQSMAIYNQ